MRKTDGIVQSKQKIGIDIKTWNLMEFNRFLIKLIKGHFKLFPMLIICCGFFNWLRGDITILQN